MTTQEIQSSTVLVIDRDALPAAELKGMIEFLDTPTVTVAGVDDWAQIAASREISAVFLGPGLTSEDTASISDALHQQFPGVPVVMVGQEGANDD